MPIKVTRVTPAQQAVIEEERKTKLHIIKKNFKGIYPINIIPVKPEILTCPSCLNSNVPGRIFIKNEDTLAVAVILAPILLFWLPGHSKKFKSCVHFCPDCRILLGITPYKGFFFKLKRACRSN